MEIGYFGDGRWARLALRRIEESEELSALFVVGRHSSPDRKLEGLAQSEDVPFWTSPNVNDDLFVEKVKAAGPDILVSMSFDQIVKCPLREVAPKGFINCHAGALPFYRGRNVLNWALINGEDELGVTVHFMDEGIDTGDIILQDFAPIEADDNYADLLEKASQLSAECLLRALLQIERGEARRRPQDEIHPVGFYCSGRCEGDEWIDWTWSSQRIHDFIRGIAPPAPGARTALDGRTIAILKSHLIEEAPAYIDRPGTVVGRDEKGVSVKTGDTTIRIETIADVNNENSLVDERTPQLAVGTIFSTNAIEVKINRIQRRLQSLEANVDPLKNGD